MLSEATVHALLLVAALHLPIVDVPATAGSSDTLVILVSGDGGWAAIDKAIANAFAANGMPVAGLNALQYFWDKRTPDGASRDLQSLIENRLAMWGKSRVVLAGYSRGADVLPAMIARLPPATRARIRLIALLGPSPRVQFEFHLADWIHDSRTGFAVAPEVEKLASQRILCVWGQEDRDSLCPAIAGPNIEKVMLKGAHHFDGGYQRLAGLVIDRLQ